MEVQKHYRNTKSLCVLHGMYRLIVKGCQMHGTPLCTKLSEFILCILCVNVNGPQEEHIYHPSKVSVSTHSSVVVKFQEIAVNVSIITLHQGWSFLSRWLRDVIELVSVSVPGPFPAMLSQCATCIDAFEFEMISSRVCLRHQNDLPFDSFVMLIMICKIFSTLCGTQSSRVDKDATVYWFL